VNVEIDGWLRLNGLNLLRDGTLKPAQLSPWQPGNSHKRLYWDAVQILDGVLAKRLAADILRAIRAHVAGLPEKRRQRPPVALKHMPSQSPGPAKLKPLPPPERLMPPPGRGALSKLVRI
jgi:hypothetical protein